MISFITVILCGGDSDMSRPIDGNDFTHGVRSSMARGISIQSVLGRGANVAGFLGDAGVDPEGLVGREGWSMGRGDTSPCGRLPEKK